MNHRHVDTIESLVRSAGNSVRPSTDLRANILTSATENEVDRSADKRLSLLIMLLFSLFLLVSIAARLALLEWNSDVGSRTDRHVYARSEQLAKQHHQQAESSFAEAFWQMKREIAGRFHNSNP